MPPSNNRDQTDRSHTKIDDQSPMFFLVPNDALFYTCVLVDAVWDEENDRVHIDIPERRCPFDVWAHDGVRGIVS